MIAIDVAEQRSIHRERRAGQLKREEIEADKQLEAAETVAGPEPAIATDGSGFVQGVHNQDQLYVTDLVTPIDREATASVVRVSSQPAGEFFVENVDETVAEYNDCHPDEDVYVVVFGKRTTKDIDSLTRYPYPRSKLEVVARAHGEEGSE